MMLYVRDEMVFKPNTRLSIACQNDDFGQFLIYFIFVWLSV